MKPLVNKCTVQQASGDKFCEYCKGKRQNCLPGRVTRRREINDKSSASYANPNATARCAQSLPLDEPTVSLQDQDASGTSSFSDFNDIYAGLAEGPTAHAAEFTGPAPCNSGIPNDLFSQNSLDCNIFPAGSGPWTLPNDATSTVPYHFLSEPYSFEQTANSTRASFEDVGATDHTNNITGGCSGKR